MCQSRQKVDGDEAEPVTKRRRQSAVSINELWLRTLTFLWWIGSCADILNWMRNESTGLRSQINRHKTPPGQGERLGKLDSNIHASDLPWFKQLTKFKPSFTNLFASLLPESQEPNFQEMTLKEVQVIIGFKNSTLKYFDNATLTRNELKPPANSSVPIPVQNFDTLVEWYNGLQGSVKKQLVKDAVALKEMLLSDVTLPPSSAGHSSDRVPTQTSDVLKPFDEDTLDLDLLFHVLIALSNRCGLASPSDLRSPIYAHASPSFGTQSSYQFVPGLYGVQAFITSISKLVRGDSAFQPDETLGSLSNLLDVLLDDDAEELSSASGSTSPDESDKSEPTPVQNEFLDLCMWQYEFQGSRGHKGLALTMRAISAQIKDRKGHTKLDWLSTGFLDLLEFEESSEAESPVTLTKDSDEYTEATTELQHLNIELASSVSDLESFRTGLPELQNAEVEAKEAWRKAHDAWLKVHVGAEKEAVLLTKLRDKIARLQAAVDSAVDPPPKPRAMPPPPAKSPSASQSSVKTSTPGGSSSPSAEEIRTYTFNEMLQHLREATSGRTIGDFEQYLIDQLGIMDEPFPKEMSAHDRMEHIFFQLTGVKAKIQAPK